MPVLSLRPLPLTPRRMRALAQTSFSKLVLSEIEQARERVVELEREHPRADRKKLARKLVASKKKLARTSGAISGLFGAVSVPLDLLFVVYLQLSLIVEIGVLHRANLKSTRAHSDLVDLLAWSNGATTLTRAWPRLFGRLAVALLHKGGLKSVGRAVPVVAAPLGAWLNDRALERAAREAMRHFGRGEARALPTLESA